MATLKERLAEEMRTALKGGDRVALGSLRLLAAAIKNREVEVGRALSDDEVRGVARGELKKRREAAEAYEAAGRPDRARRERDEADALGPYLPEEVPADELERLVETAIAETGAAGPGDLGKVMGRVMKQVAGHADGRVVQRMVRERLGA